MSNNWNSEYPKSLSENLSNIDNDTVIDLLESSAREYESKIAYYSLNSSLNYKMTSLLSKRLAAYLQYLGVRKDTKIAIMLPNLLTYPISLFGSYYCGATVINVNPMYKSREIQHLLEDSEAEYIFVLDKFYNELQPCIKNSKLKKIIVCRINDLLNPLMKLVIPMVLLFKKQSVVIEKHKNIIYFNDIISNNFGFEDVHVEQDDIALLQYTGGTTGKSKAAILTHKNPGEEIIITALPLFHIFSFTVNCLTFLKIGAENVLIANPRDLKSFLKVLKKKKFTVMTAVNTLFNLLLTSKNFKELDFSSFKFSVGGGMAVMSETAKNWKKVTGTNITQGYGLTETSPVVSINKIDSLYNGSLGLPVQSTNIKIIDENGEKINDKQPGELCVKGPQVMSGYWKYPEDQENPFTDDGFLKREISLLLAIMGILLLLIEKKI